MREICKVKLLLIMSIRRILRYGNLVKDWQCLSRSQISIFTSIVQDELAFELENYGIERSIIEQRLQDVLQQMELVSIQHQHVMSLSSGQKQKLPLQQRN